jgi:hypothetical protein
MSTTLTQEKANLAKDEGILKKVFAAIQKLFAKEFLWILFLLILGLPMGLILTFVIQHFASTEVRNIIQEIIKNTPLFIACYLLSLIGFYFTRIIVGAIEMLVKKTKG